MRLFASCSNGRVYFCEMGTNCEWFADFAFDELDNFVELLIFFVKINAFNDGSHIMNSSSMDFSDEEGWPEASAREWIERGFEELNRRAEAILAERERFAIGASD